MPLFRPVVCFRWFLFLWSFLIWAPAKSSFPGERAFSACWLGHVGSVQLRDVMDICVMAVKCMGQAAVCVAAVQLWGVTPGALFQHNGIRWAVPRDGGPCCQLALLALHTAMALLLASSFSWQPSCFQRTPSGHSYSNVFVWLKLLVLNHHMCIFSGIWLWHRKSIPFLA